MMGMTTIDLDTITLHRGHGTPARPGTPLDQVEGCAMDWAWIIDAVENRGMSLDDAIQQFADTVECVCPIIRSAIISYSDRPNNEERQLLKPILRRALGTKSTREVYVRRGYVFADWAVRKIVPVVYDVLSFTAEAERLRSLPEITGVESAMDAAALCRELRASMKYDRWYWAADATAAATTASTTAAAAATAPWAEAGRAAAAWADADAAARALVAAKAWADAADAADAAAWADADAAARAEAAARATLAQLSIEMIEAAIAITPETVRRTP